ncbi:hypothetical protein [Nioella sp. MMSF_3534]|uniref:hypothetical protein n=1 Tax=Nioella sp. MMSF_3534 TaxID=3046720 RepID=UPI00273F3CD8|nr:hypothetical protein [Nioella sp. MMSF_3534]
MDDASRVETHTLAELRSVFLASGLKSSFDFWMAPTHELRLQCLEKILDKVYSRVVLDRHLTHSESEDQLNSRIVGMLASAGLNASHDTQWGGHVDVAVTGPDDFFWMAEAKFDNGYAWLKKGFYQLTTRYMPGCEGADCGELIIYGRKKNALKALKNWASVIARLDQCRMEEDHCDEKLWFRTSHVSEGTGRRIRVRHKILTLWFEPKDR